MAMNLLKLPSSFGINDLVINANNSPFIFETIAIEHVKLF